MNKAHPVRGYVYIGSATFLWGTAPTMGRAAFTGRLPVLGQALQPIDPLILAQSRTTFSSLILLPIMLMRRAARSLKLPASHFVPCFPLSTLAIATSN